MTGRRDSEAEDREDDTLPPATESMPRAEVPPSVNKISDLERAGLENEITV